MATPDQAVFGRDMIFNLAPVVYWLVATAMEQRQVDINNVIENTKRVTHDYDTGDQVYVKMTGIYRKIYYKKQVPHRITEVFTYGTVRVQYRKVDERINIRRLNPHFDE